MTRLKCAARLLLSVAMIGASVAHAAVSAEEAAKAVPNYLWQLLIFQAKES